MGRRRKNESLVETLIVLPWWIGVGLGVTGLISLARATFNSSRKASSFTPGVSAKSFTARDGARIEPGMVLAPSHLNTADQRLQQTAESAQNIASKTDNWSVDALRELEWKHFELLCAKYYEAVGCADHSERKAPLWFAPLVKISITTGLLFVVLSLVVRQYLSE